MGCSDSKPEEPIMDLKAGEKVVGMASLWLMVDPSVDAKKVCMIDANVALEFVEYGPEGADGAEFIKVKYGTGGNMSSGAKEGYVLFWSRRGSTGKGPKDSKIKRVA